MKINGFVLAALLVFMMFVVIEEAGAEENSKCGDILLQGKNDYEKANYDSGLKEFSDARECYFKLSKEVETADSATCLNSMGEVHNKKVEYDKAIENYNRALEIRLKIFGEEHPDTATTYNDIGSVYNSKGDYAKAFDNCNRALKIRLKTVRDPNRLTAGGAHHG